MWGQLSQEGPESLDMWGPAGGLPDDFISMPMHSGFAAWRSMPPAPPPIPEQQPHDRPSRRWGPSWAWRSAWHTGLWLLHAQAWEWGWARIT